MSRPLSLVAGLAMCAGLSGCALKTYTVQLGDQPPEDAHYIIVQQGAGMMKVYDCRSAPDGRDWEPTCVKVDMRSSPPKD